MTGHAGQSVLSRGDGDWDTLGNQEVMLGGLNAPTWQRIPLSDLASNLDQTL